MNDVLHISIEKNAIYSSLPRVVSVFVSLFAGFASDWMYKTGYVDKTKVRKIFVALGLNSKTKIHSTITKQYLVNS